MLRALCPWLGLVLLPACREEPPPPSDVAQSEETAESERTPAQLDAEIRALAEQDSLAARLRHDALLRIQKGELELELLEVHFFYDGEIERAERAFPGHLFAGNGDYVATFEPAMQAHLAEVTGLELKVHAISLSEPRTAQAPCVTIAYSARELGTVETPEGEFPKLSFAVSLMGTFTQDLGNAVRHEIEFFTVEDEPQWVEGQSPRRLIGEQPIGRAQARVKEWLGEIALVTPK